MIEVLDIRTEQVVERFGEKVAVFEVTQQKEVDGDTYHQPEGPCRFFLRIVNAKADEVIGQSREQQQYEERTAGFEVEKQTGQKQEGIAHRPEGVDEGIDHQHSGEKSPKVPLGKDQGSILRKTEYVFEQLHLAIRTVKLLKVRVIGLHERVEHQIGHQHIAGLEQVNPITVGQTCTDPGFD